MASDRRPRPGGRVLIAAFVEPMPLGGIVWHRFWWECGHVEERPEQGEGTPPMVDENDRPSGRSESEGNVSRETPEKAAEEEEASCGGPFESVEPLLSGFRAQVLRTSPTTPSAVSRSGRTLPPSNLSSNRPTTGPSLSKSPSLLTRPRLRPPK